MESFYHEDPSDLFGVFCTADTQDLICASYSIVPVFPGYKVLRVMQDLGIHPRNPYLIAVPSHFLFSFPFAFAILSPRYLVSTVASHFDLPFLADSISPVQIPDLVTCKTREI